MSVELVTAIYRRLAGQEDLSGYPLAAAAQTWLSAALADDPDVPSIRGGAVFSSSLDEAKTASGLTPLPCITFRLAGGAPDPRFCDGVDVGRVLVELEAWVEAGAVELVHSILENVATLLDRRRGAAPALSTGASGRVWWTEAVMLPQIIYDRAHDMTAGLTRWEIVSQRVYE